MQQNACSFLFFGRGAAAAAHNISTEAERGITFSFLVAALLLLFTHREGYAENNKIGFCFLFDTGTQSIAFSVVVVVDCAAVETGCMLEKYIKVAHQLRVLQQKKGIHTYLVRIQNFLFHFPFDEIYRRLLFFTLGRSVSA